MKNYKICFLNISEGLRTKTYFAKDEIDALNKLLVYLNGNIKKVNSIEEIKPQPEFLGDCGF